MESVRVEGFKELFEKLNQLEPKRVKPAVRKALRAGARLVLTEARTRVPVRTGALKKSMKVRGIKLKRGMVGIAVHTGAGHMFMGDQYYGGMVHYGTEKQKAQPWLRESFEATKDEIIKAIATSIRTTLETL